MYYRIGLSKACKTYNRGSYLENIAKMRLVLYDKAGIECISNNSTLLGHSHLLHNSPKLTSTNLWTKKHHFKKILILQEEIFNPITANLQCNYVQE